MKDPRRYLSGNAACCGAVEMPKVAPQILGFGTRQARGRPTAESLVAVSRAIGQGLELTALLRRCAQHVGRALAADESIVWWIDASDDRLKPISRIDPHVWSGVSLIGSEVSVRPRLVHLHPPSSTRHVSTRVSRQPMTELLRRSVHRTMLVLPFRVNGLTSGALTLFWSDGRRQPTREEVAVAEAAARQVSTAVGYTEHLSQLQNARDQLQSHSRQIARARERERERLAREIHDELGPRLTSLKVDLTRLVQHQLEPQDQQRALEAVPASVDGLIDSVRRIAHELRPSVLDDLGLAAALEWQTQNFVRRTGVRCRLRCRGTPTVLDTECSTALFRIFQEMMANVARHAEASEVQITLTVSRTSARLEVLDNGKGMAADPESRGLGLLGMQERATALGGCLELSSEFSRGTKVQAWIPLTGHRTLAAFSRAGHRS